MIHVSTKYWPTLITVSTLLAQRIQTLKCYFVSFLNVLAENGKAEITSSTSAEKCVGGEVEANINGFCSIIVQFI